MAEVNFQKAIKTDASAPASGVVIDVQATPADAAPATPAEIPVTIPATVLPPAAEIPATAVAVVPKVEVPARADSPVDFDDENIGFEDIILPRINIVQKVGDLSNVFTPGEIVLNQSIVIHEPENKERKIAGTLPLIFTVLGFKKKQFTEKVEGGKLGLLVNSEQAVVSAGGTLDYKEWQSSLKPGGSPKKYFQRLATALLLVQRPEHFAQSDADHILFPYECQGAYYALVLWSMKGTAFTHAAKKIFTARKIGHLRGGYPLQTWSLTTKLEPFGENWTHVPVIKDGPRNSEAFLSFVKEVLGAAN